MVNFFNDKANGSHIGKNNNFQKTLETKIIILVAVLIFASAYACGRAYAGTNSVTSRECIQTPRYDQARTYTACYVSRCVAQGYGLDLFTGEEIEYEDVTPDIHVGDIIASYVTWDEDGDVVASWDVTLPTATL